jgi:hypothetical protein
MATTYIPINTSVRLGASLRRAVDLLTTARDQLADLKAAMDTQVNGTDYSMVESQFGLQTGQGQTLYNLVAGVVSDQTGFNTVALIGRCA